MDQGLLLALLISGLWSPSSAWFRYYYLVTQQKTWVEARSYCRQQYTDLATVDNMTEMEQLYGQVPAGFSTGIWIGLSRGTSRSWGWSSGEPFQYTNWNLGQPNNGDKDGLCGAMVMSGRWRDQLCEKKGQFICYSESPRTFVLVNISDTWRNAQRYCRQNYTDLATIHNDQENHDVWNLLSSQDYVWIGLFFDNWVWSDGKKTTLHNWHYGEPYSLISNGTCAAVVPGWQGDWDDVPCITRLSFMCYKALRRNGRIRLKITSDGMKELNDPAVMTAILAEIEQNLRRQGMGNDTTLGWQTIKGKVFNLENIQEEQQKCSSLTPVISQT